MGTDPAPRRGRRRAATTLVALMLTTALGTAVASYLSLVSQSHRLGLRQLQNDQMRELVEVGFEEALWALNQNDWTSGGPASATAWTTAGANRTVTLTYPGLAGGATGQAVLSVNNFASSGPIWPTITVQATVILLNGRVATRTEFATTGPLPVFSHALASAVGGVSFVGGGAVDSWNSDPDNNPLTPAVSYSFVAGDPANYAAVIAGADADGVNGVVLTQAQVSGYVTTTDKPVSTSVSGSPPGRVRGPLTPALIDVDPTRLGRSAFVPVRPVFQIQPPTVPGMGLLATLIALLGNVVDAIMNLLGLDLFQTPGDLDIQNTASKPNLTVDRPMTIVVTGNLNISGTGRIRITPTGSLHLILRGGGTIAGIGIINQTGDSSKCVIFSAGPSSGGPIVYNTTSDFRGVIYSENKPIDIRQNATFYGALLSRNSITFTNSATNPVFHYDSALRNRRFPYLSTPYVIRQRTQL